jgi:hypothetical protein
MPLLADSFSRCEIQGLYQYFKVVSLSGECFYGLQILFLLINFSPEIPFRSNTSKSRLSLTGLSLTVITFFDEFPLKCIIFDFVYTILGYKD